MVDGSGTPRSSRPSTMSADLAEDEPEDEPGDGRDGPEDRRLEQHGAAQLSLARADAAQQGERAGALRDEHLERVGDDERGDEQRHRGEPEDDRDQHVPAVGELRRPTRAAASSLVSASASGTTGPTASRSAVGADAGPRGHEDRPSRARVSDSAPLQRRSVVGASTRPAPPLCDHADAGSDAMPVTTTSSSTVRQTSSDGSADAVGVGGRGRPRARTWSSGPARGRRRRTPRASAVAGGRAISPVAAGAAPSSTTSELSRGSSVVGSMSCQRLVPPLRISMPIGARTSAAWTSGRARTASSSASVTSPCSDDVGVGVGRGDRVVAGAGHDVAGDQGGGEERGADRDGDGGGGEPAEAAAHLRQGEAQHQRAAWSSARRASRPVSTDSGVGSAMSPAIRPSASRTTRSAYAAAVGSCVTMMIVRPSSRTERRRKLSTSAPERESRLPVGSSAKTTSGLAMSARAIATRCCWPPDSSDGPVREPLTEPEGGHEGVEPLAVHRRAGQLERQQDVLLGGEHRQQVEALEDEPDAVAAQPGQRAVVERGDLRGAEPGGARRGLVEAREHVHQRRLARAGRPHDRRERPGREVDVDPVERADLGGALAVDLGERPGAHGDR